MNRQLGIAGIVIGTVTLVMGVVVLLVPTASVGLGIGFLVVGVALTAVGIWTATSQRFVETKPPGGPTQPVDGRSRSRFHQILDGLGFFS